MRHHRQPLPLQGGRPHAGFLGLRSRRHRGVAAGGPCLLLPPREGSPDHGSPRCRGLSFSVQRFPRMMMGVRVCRCVSFFKYGFTYNNNDNVARLDVCESLKRKWNKMIFFIRTWIFIHRLLVSINPKNEELIHYFVFLQALREERNSSSIITQNS